MYLRLYCVYYYTTRLPFSVRGPRRALASDPVCWLRVTRLRTYFLGPRDQGLMMEMFPVEPWARYVKRDIIKTHCTIQVAKALLAWLNLSDGGFSFFPRVADDGAFAPDSTPRIYLHLHTAPVEVIPFRLWLKV